MSLFCIEPFSNIKISTISSNFYCENPLEEVYIRYNGDLTVSNMLNPYIYGNCNNYPSKNSGIA